eukprot:1569762-Pleurochrysis_carterae.AAC.1
MRTTLVLPWRLPSTHFPRHCPKSCAIRSVIATNYRQDRQDRPQTASLPSANILRPKLRRKSGHMCKTARQVEIDCLVNVFSAGVNCKVIQRGLLDKKGVGAVRAVEDNNGFQLRQIICSMVEESQYSYRSFASCGPLGSFASSHGFCNATMSINRQLTYGGSRLAVYCC